jgi:fucose 4-O-acetylase-like acetyltransferase
MAKRQESGAESPLSAAARLNGLDVAKGLAIILVVVGHAGRGVTTAGLTDTDSWLPLLDRLIYSFHMPVFFVVSGALFGLREPSGSLSTFLWSRTTRMMLPLLIWTYVFLGVRMAAGDLANNATSLSEFLVWPLPPFAHMWFLWALLLITLVSATADWSMRGILDRRVRLFFILLLACAGSQLLQVDRQLEPWFQDALKYGPYFGLGAWLAALLPQPIVVRAPLAIACLCTFFAGLGFVSSQPLPVRGIVVGVLLSLAFCGVCLWSADRWLESRLVRLLRYLGVISLAIYVAHTIFSAATRAVLLKAGFEDVTLHMVLGTLTGLVGPVLLYRLAVARGIEKRVGLG